MTSSDDTTLLRQWAEARSETAFRLLVERYAPLVWGAALRKTGDRSMSEEASQQVFADLARKAPALAASSRPLAAWLHRSAVYEAVQVLRREIRHRDRMKNYTAQETATLETPDPWEDVRPHLDEAMNSLSEPDRRVLLLHWYQRKTFADAATEIGCTPAAAQRRGLRALEKLAAALRRRGTVASAAVLAAGLTAQLTPTVGAATLAGLTTAGTSAAGVSGAALLTQNCLHAMASAKLATAAVFLVSAALPVGWQAVARHTEARDRADKTSAPYMTEMYAQAAVLSAPAATLDTSLVQSAIARLLANDNDYDTELALRRLMFSLTLEEIPTVQALLMAVPDRKKERLYEVSHALFARWAELDPTAAIAAAAAVPRSAFGFYPLRGAFVTWAATDLDTAWAWLETRPDAMDRNFLGGEALATNVAFQNSGKAMMARADAVPDAAWRRELRYWVMREWVKSNPHTEIMEWAHSQPQEEREEIIAWSVEMLGAHRPDVAEIYFKSIENPDRRAEAMHNVLWPCLLARDPGSVVSPPEFVDNLYERTESYPPDIFRDAGDAITRHGAHHALARLQKFPEGAARDEFIQGMLRSVAYTEAKALLPAVAMLSDEQLVRHGGLSQFTKVFTQQDPRAAAEWITSLPADSTARKWAGSHFQGATGRSADEFLNSSVK
jgi:RNA polymerase sigma factor (sigma-70 family)